MLSHLEIRNYALIEELELDFSSGFSIITGETGAGKSIMLGALSLLSGARADSRVARREGKKTVVEAVFEDTDPALAPIVAKAGVAVSGEGEIILRREIVASGRSRAFINDTPVPVQQLAEVGSRLIDIHSQHNNLLIASGSHQLEILDCLAGNKELVEQYREVFGEYVTLRSRLANLREEMARSRENRDFLTFRLEHLDKLRPRRGEWDKLSRMHDILSDAGEIRDWLSRAVRMLEGEESSALARVADARESLRHVDFSLFENREEPDTPGLRQRLESLYVELKDISATVADHAARVQADEGTLRRVSSRLDALHEAVKRFRVADADALVDLHEELRHSLSLIDGGNQDAETLEKEVKTLGRKLREHAEALSQSRARAAAGFADMLTERCRPLGLPNLRFSVMLGKGKLSASGQDTVEFLCAFNKNQELEQLQKVASGGETARLMLCIKGIVAGKMRQPTVIFDEIDTGVSGDIADRMGAMMERMGENMQVMAITHLPQVAARGREHYRVYKSDEADRTLTRVERLDGPSREREIAKMLAGADVGTAAIENARALLRAASVNKK